MKIEEDGFIDNTKYRVKIIIDDTEISEYNFDDIQKAVACYDEEMKKDYNELKDFCICVQEQTHFGFWSTLIFFHCRVEELHVLLKSS